MINKLQYPKKLFSKAAVREQQNKLNRRMWLFKEDRDNYYLVLKT